MPVDFRAPAADGPTRQARVRARAAHALVTVATGRVVAWHDEVAALAVTARNMCDSPRICDPDEGGTVRVLDGGRHVASIVPRRALDPSAYAERAAPAGDEPAPESSPPSSAPGRAVPRGRSGRAGAPSTRDVSGLGRWVHVRVDAAMAADVERVAAAMPVRPSVAAVLREAVTRGLRAMGGGE